MAIKSVCARGLLSEGCASASLYIASYMLRLRHACARLLLQPVSLTLCDARRWLAKDSKTPAQTPASKQQQQPAWRGQARKIKADLATVKANAKGSLRTQNFLLRNQITALQQSGRWRDVIPA
eukprot:9020-Heterococcus_DN1.PRE.4